MGVLYIAVILMCRFAQHLYEKKTSLMVEGVPELLRFNGIRQCISAALALALIIVGGNGLRINAPTLLLSLLSGNNAGEFHIIFTVCNENRYGIARCIVRNGRNDHSVFDQVCFYSIHR